MSELLEVPEGDPEGVGESLEVPVPVEVAWAEGVGVPEGVGESLEVPVTEFEGVLEDVGEPLDVEELASFLRCSTSTLYTMVSQKRIPYLKVGRLTRFSLDDIEAWMKKSASSAKECTD